MVQVVLSNAQLQAIRNAIDGIELVDADGLTIGLVDTGVTTDDLRIVRERMAANEPGLSLTELLDRVRAHRTINNQ
jgi:hypothetical protein